MSLDTLPPFGNTALLLDFDGTLVDLAPRPDDIIVAPGLTHVLHQLRSRLDGALGIVTGRPIETIDTMLGDAPWAVAGEHGGALRYEPGGLVERPPLPAPPAIWIREAERLVSLYPGALLERKARGFALHYRGAPEAGPVFYAALTEMLVGQAAFQLLSAHMLWEVRPGGVDKGSAVGALMTRLPFKGRLPLFIGDDVTDEDGMAVARAIGGSGLRVDAAFGAPADVRTWLHLAATTGTWPPLLGQAA